MERQASEPAVTCMEAGGALRGGGANDARQECLALQQVGCVVVGYDPEGHRSAFDRESQLDRDRAIEVGELAVGEAAEACGGAVPGDRPDLIGDRA